MIQKIVYSLALVIGLAVSSYSQFGVSAKYNSNGFSEYYNGDFDLFDSNLEFGANYWFRLKNHRVEFLPELIYGLSTSSEVSGVDVSVLNYSRNYLGLQFNTHIYLFDLENDCNCPTFSKQGPNIGKGLYFSVSPGVYRVSVTEDSFDDTETGIIPTIAAGLGYDIGISDLLTITPFFSYRLGLSPESIQTTTNELQESKSTIMQAGIRVTFRPDYVNQYGR